MKLYQPTNINNFQHTAIDTAYAGNYKYATRNKCRNAKWLTNKYISDHVQWRLWLQHFNDTYGRGDFPACI